MSSKIAAFIKKPSILRTFSIFIIVAVIISSMISGVIMYFYTTKYMTETKSDDIKKAVEDAKKNVINVPIVKTTIPHSITGIAGAGQVFLKPAPAGTGIIAGGPVRNVVELAGIQDIFSKSQGSSTPINIVRATFEGLKQLRTIEEVAEIRGKKVEEIKG